MACVISMSPHASHSASPACHAFPAQSSLQAPQTWHSSGDRLPHSPSRWADTTHHRSSSHALSADPSRESSQQSAAASPRPDSRSHSPVSGSSRFPIDHPTSLSPPSRYVLPNTHSFASARSRAPSPVASKSRTPDRDTSDPPAACGTSPRRPASTGPTRWRRLCAVLGRPDCAEAPPSSPDALRVSKCRKPHLIPTQEEATSAPTHAHPPLQKDCTEEDSALRHARRHYCQGEKGTLH